MMLRSIVEYYAEHERYRCGYCKGVDTNYGHGMWAHTMTVTDYQNLIDRGWRRSGKYVYKPTLDVICCPSYTIRCRANEFKPSKSQKKVLKQFNKYLMGQEEKEAGGSSSQHIYNMSEDINVLDYTEGTEMFVETRNTHQDINLMGVVSGEGDNVEEIRPLDNSSHSEATNNKVTRLKNDECKKGPDPTKAPCKKAKQLRIERKLEKMKQKGSDISYVPKNNKNKEKQLEDFINELPLDTKHKLEIKLVRTTPPSDEWLQTAKETHQVYVKYQTTVHGDTREKCTVSKFSEFLVSSPLLAEYSESGPSCGYGSFHQQYWLDGRIIAVGVIDVLPKCVSSVYFFYDPQHRHLTLGTYGALREIEFTRHLHLRCPALKYYYMGFYIHSCPKMRYKGNYHPSDLLCPETYKWFPIKNCIPRLEITSYSRLDPDIDSKDDDYPIEDVVNYIPILLSSEVIPYMVYLRKTGKKESFDIMLEYAKFVGTKTAKSLIIVR